MPAIEKIIKNADRLPHNYWVTDNRILEIEIFRNLHLMVYPNKSGGISTRLRLKIFRGLTSLVILGLDKIHETKRIAWLKKQLTYNLIFFVFTFYIYFIENLQFSLAKLFMVYFLFYVIVFGLLYWRICETLLTLGLMPSTGT